MKETIRSIEQTVPQHIALYTDNRMGRELLEKQDLLNTPIATLFTHHPLTTPAFLRFPSRWATI